MKDKKRRRSISPAFPDPFELSNKFGSCCCRAARQSIPYLRKSRTLVDARTEPEHEAEKDYPIEGTGLPQVKP
jgi:hypothetical protein